MLQNYKATEDTWLIVRDQLDFKLPVLLLKDQELITKKPIIEEYPNRVSFLNRLTELDIPYEEDEYIAPIIAKPFRVKNVYKILRELIPNTYTDVCNVLSNGNKCSSVELSYEGANGSEVLVGHCYIVASSTNYIYIEGESGGTEELIIRVKSDGNDNFTIQVKAINTETYIPLFINLSTDNNEQIRTSDFTAFNVTTLEHSFKPDTKVIASTQNPKVEINGGLVWHSSNDGTGSGLDADVLDGMQPFSLAVPNSIVARDNQGNIKVNLIEGSAPTAPQGNDSGLIANTAYVQTELERKLDLAIYTGTDILNRLKFVDGPGSGLDADSIDGLQGTDIVRTTTNQSIAGNKTFVNDLTVLGTLTFNGINNVLDNISLVTLGGTTAGIDLFTLPSVGGTTSYLLINPDNSVDTLPAKNYNQSLVNGNLITVELETESPTAIDFWDMTVYRTAKYLIQITQGINIYVAELTVIHDGVDIISSGEYGVVSNISSLATISFTKVDNDIRLMITMLSDSLATIRLDKKLILL